MLLAALPTHDFEAYLSGAALTAFSETTITRPAELRREIERIRRVGFALSAGEFTMGGYAVASVIKAPADYELAALHFSIPLSRYSTALQRRCVDRIMQGVEAVSVSLTATP